MKISTIAVILTCHNRKDKTIICLKTLFESKQASSLNFEIDVYLTDDGSTDGTSSAIRLLFPSVNILKGDGNLFWAGGMRNSWKEALRKKNYDGFLLLNDDSVMDKKCFDELFKTHEFSLNQYGTGSIYIGSLRDQDTLEHTYGGRIIINKWFYSHKDIIPTGSIRECHLGNANIMFVTRNVVEAIGIFDDRYIHAKADFDYTLRAIERQIPVLVCPDYCGYCTRDEPELNFKQMNLKERIQYLKSPKGFELSGYMYFMRRFFPWRAPFVFCSLWMRTLIPKYSEIIDKVMKRQNISDWTD